MDPPLLFAHTKIATVCNDIGVEIFESGDSEFVMVLYITFLNRKRIHFALRPSTLLIAAVWWKILSVSLVVTTKIRIRSYWTTPRRLLRRCILASLSQKTSRGTGAGSAQPVHLRFQGRAE